MDEQWLLDADEQAAWRSFVDMHHLLERHLASNLQREFGLSAADFEILVNLSEAPAGRLRAYELGRATSWEKSRLSHHLGRMEKRGLVSREPDPHGDSRFPQIVLTAAGRAAIGSAAPANAARVRRLFIDVLGRERLAIFRQASEDVIAAIQENRSDYTDGQLRRLDHRSGG
ncbi:MarR family transcriptional regulator [Mycobacterium kubicae]|uniref:MarR family transcriptional regulator n=1 Tax=Mycobacterium kubicae TaxID=120959 RepID=A0AAX1J9G3_9MYCO|nr:MarR family winged helix-turn-helix transcriptional regulator [Mycobacterium kubicae]MCV7094240.1 winged helix-turn-helix transcriptional regulator [Mycobacterium kubicae]QNI09949.1 winged helix-turn-helix transcriptional regulator [Mycobacterium kubicae]QPI38148.1 winged helix-turn-helix transcriptional regulator [Mycobacterium kubicae]GFG65498.1 MarR family transcriptional regulator [Mycobacterium kubicae]